jgi:hypothetical protein
MESSPLNPELRRGRLCLLIAIAVLLVGELLVICNASLHRPVEPISVIRWFITAAICAAMWHGRKWARWLTLALLVPGLLMVGSSLFKSVDPTAIGLALGFGIAFLLLACEPSVPVFMEFQRVRHSDG